MEIAGLIISVFGLVMVPREVGGVICSYRDGNLDIRAINAKYQCSKILFKRLDRVLGSSSDSPTKLLTPEDQVLVDTLVTLRDISTETDRKLAKILRTDGLTADIRDNRTRPNLEHQERQGRPPMFASRRAKISWSLGGGMQRLSARVQMFCELVDGLYRLLPSSSHDFIPSTPRGDAILWSSQSIWLTDVRGIRRQLNLGLCSTPPGFIMCLLLALKSSRGSLDPQARARLLAGEFCLFLDPPAEHEGRYPISAIGPILDHNGGPNQGSVTDAVPSVPILADTWEKVVQPGAEYRMVMVSCDPNGDVRTRRLDTHGPWEDKVKPALSDILELVGWNR